MRLPLLASLLSLSALADAVLVDRIAATVDLHVITRATVEARARPRLAEAKGVPAQAQVRREALDQLIDERLIAEDAHQLGLRVTEDEIDRALGEVAKQNAMTVEALGEAVRRQGFELPAYRAMVRAQLLELRWLAAKGTRDAAPTPPGERAEWMARERARLVQALRQKAVIEVRP